MEKISGILPSSLRVTSVDIKKTFPVRPGVPSFGGKVDKTSSLDQINKNQNIENLAIKDKVSIESLEKDFFLSKNQPNKEVIYDSYGSTQQNKIIKKMDDGVIKNSLVKGSLADNSVIDDSFIKDDFIKDDVVNNSIVNNNIVDNSTV